MILLYSDATALLQSRFDADVHYREYGSTFTISAHNSQLIAQLDSTNIMEITDYQYKRIAFKSDTSKHQ